MLRSFVATGALGLAIAAASIAGGCGSTPPAAEPKPQAVAAPPVDVCIGSPPAKKQYTGILKHIRCDQDLYATMADVAGSLNVECEFCHAQEKGGEGKKFDFPAMTEKKQIALFMHHEFVEGLKQKDGSAVECASCHIDKNGKPSAKFLGEPRDERYALEWMNLVMVNKFTHLDGEKLKCRDCHVGNFGTPDFQKKVILQGEQVKLHGVTPFQPFPENPPSPPVPPPCHPKSRPQEAPPLPGQHAGIEIRAGFAALAAE